MSARSQSSSGSERGVIARVWHGERARYYPEDSDYLIALEPTVAHY